MHLSTWVACCNAAPHVFLSLLFFTSSVKPSIRVSIFIWPVTWMQHWTLLDALSKQGANPGQQVLAGCTRAVSKTVCTMFTQHKQSITKSRRDTVAKGRGGSHFPKPAQECWGSSVSATLTLSDEMSQCEDYFTASIRPPNVMSVVFNRYYCMFLRDFPILWCSARPLGINALDFFPLSVPGLSHRLTLCFHITLDGVWSTVGDCLGFCSLSLSRWIWPPHEAGCERHMTAALPSFALLLLDGQQWKRLSPSGWRDICSPENRDS